MCSIGDKVRVLLPYWIQSVDDVEPYVEAVVVSVNTDSVKVLYSTPYGKRDFVIEGVRFPNGNMVWVPESRTNELLKKV